MHSILVPLDGSEHAEQILPLTIALAKAFKSEVELFYVVDTADMPATIRWQGHDRVDGLLGLIRQRASEYIEGVQARLAGNGVNASYRVALGSPSLEIGLEASSRGSGLVAMSTHGRHGLARWVVGSVADKVLRTATVPLLLYHPTEEEVRGARGISSVLVPLNGTPEAAAAIPLAVTIAETLDVPIRIVRVVPNQPYALYEDGAEFIPFMADLVVDAEDELERVVSELEQCGVAVEKTVLHGDPATSLIDWMDRQPGGLVVMTTHGRSGFERAVLGSVADKLIRSGVAPVVVMTPEATGVEEPAYATSEQERSA